MPPRPPLGVPKSTCHPECQAITELALPQEDAWIRIQANTFKNWVNVNLKECGLEVADLSTDFTDGTR